MPLAVFEFDTSVLGQKSETVECSIQSYLRFSPSKWSVVWTGRSQPIPKSLNKNILVGFDSQSTYRVKLLNCTTATGETLHTAPSFFETRFSDDRDVEMLGTFVAFRSTLTARVCKTPIEFERQISPLSAVCLPDTSNQTRIGYVEESSLGETAAISVSLFFFLLVFFALRSIFADRLCKQRILSKSGAKMDAVRESKSGLKLPQLESACPTSKQHASFISNTNDIDINNESEKSGDTSKSSTEIDEILNLDLPHIDDANAWKDFFHAQIYSKKDDD